MALPSAWPSYARMLGSRRPALAAAGVTVDARAEARAVVAPARALAAYRRVCGFAAGAVLPITYPHALASPLHLALLAGRAFPVRPLGLVHVRNTIRALQPIPERASLDFVCTLRGPRETGRGQEFDLETEVRVDRVAVWTETAVVLARRAGGRGDRPPAPAAPPPGRPVARWELPPGLGRRYAAASGDWNPIHLSAATARIFGFRRAIAHGMWSLARAAAELRLGEEDVLLEAAFKLPVLLPAALTLLAARHGVTTGFTVADADGVRPHLVGTAGPLGRGA